MKLGVRTLQVLAVILALAWIALAGWIASGCADHHGRGILDLRGDGVAPPAQEQGALYVRAGLPLPHGPVTVSYTPKVPGFTGPGNHTTVFSNGEVVCFVDRWDALPHELLHAAMLRNGDPSGDSDHASYQWQHKLLWPPGSLPPPAVAKFLSSP